MAQSYSLGPLQVTQYTAQEGAPDSVTLYSSVALTAAPQLTVRDPLPPVGSLIIMQLDIPRVFVFDAAYTVKAGDTPASVAAALAGIINNGAGIPADQLAMQAAGVYAGNTVGSPIIAVTNPANGRDLVTLSDQSVPPGALTPAVATGNLAWDAGPILGLGKKPRDPATGLGIAPPPGSNIMQLVAAAYASNGIADFQYMTFSVNVIDPVTGKAEFAIYTKNTGEKILSLTDDGLWINGRKIA